MTRGIVELPRPGLAALALLLCGSCAGPSALPAPAGPSASAGAPPPAAAPAAPGESTSVSGAEVYRHAASGLLFPPRLGGWVRVAIKDYGKRSLGHSVGYNHATVPGSVTIYLYEDQKPLPIDVLAPVVVSELKLAVQGVFQLPGRSQTQLERAGTSWLGPAPDSREALLARTRFVEAGKPISSLVFVTTFQGMFLKIRFSCPEGERGRAERQLHDLLDHLDRQVSAALIAAHRGHSGHVVLASGPTRTLAEAAWHGYLLARGGYIGKNRDRYSPVPGASVRPLFEEEVFARTALAKIWAGLKANAPGRPSDPHLDQLQKVAAAGLIREYVWVVLRAEHWPSTPPPAGLRTDDFAAFRARELAGHRAEGGGRVSWQAR